MSCRIKFKKIKYGIQSYFYISKEGLLTYVPDCLTQGFFLLSKLYLFLILSIPISSKDAVSNDTPKTVGEPPSLPERPSFPEPQGGNSAAEPRLPRAEPHNHNHHSGPEPEPEPEAHTEPGSDSTWNNGKIDKGSFYVRYVVVNIRTKVFPFFQDFFK